MESATTKARNLRHVGTVAPGTAAANERSADAGESGRIEALEHAVDALRGELAELRARFEDFRREFQ